MAAPCPTPATGYNRCIAVSFTPCTTSASGLTTAALLFRLFQPASTDLVEMRFDRIMAAVRRGEVDAGVIIHESRFTYPEEGLICLQDLGQWWETVSGRPIPLGCIVARRSLGNAMIQRIEGVVAASVAFGFRCPEECLPYIRAHSQETAVEIVENHIHLYVNDFSRNLGDEGMAAISAFLQRGRDAGILPPGTAGQPRRRSGGPHPARPAPAAGKRRR